MSNDGHGREAAKRELECAAVTLPSAARPLCSTDGSGRRRNAEFAARRGRAPPHARPPSVPLTLRKCRAPSRRHLPMTDAFAVDTRRFHFPLYLPTEEFLCSRNARADDAKNSTTDRDTADSCSRCYVNVRLSPVCKCSSVGI